MAWLLRCINTLMFVLISVCSIAHAAIDQSALTVKWGYKGNVSPAFWGRLSPSFSLCATGKEQSPINIPKKVKKTTGKLSIKYPLATLRIVKNGTTDLLLGNTHTLILDGQGIQLNFY